MTDLAAINAMRRLEAQARAVLSARSGEVVAAVREAVGVSRTVRAPAAPVLELAAGLRREIGQIEETRTRFDDAISALEPYRPLPQVAPVIGVLEAARALVVAQAAAATAKLALAALTVPAPEALGAAALLPVAEGLEAQAERAIVDLLRFVEDE